MYFNKIFFATLLSLLMVGAVKPAQANTPMGFDDQSESIQLLSMQFIDAVDMCIMGYTSGKVTTANFDVLRNDLYCGDMVRIDKLITNVIKKKEVSERKNGESCEDVINHNKERWFFQERKVLGVGCYLLNVRLKGMLRAREAYSLTQ